MSFPIDPLPQKSEIYIDGAWLDLTALGRIRRDADVVITRGRQNEQSSVSPATCAFTINNRDGEFSNRNPLSTYYGKLRHNVPMRQSVTEATPFARFAPWLTWFYTDLSDNITASTNLAGHIYTADKAVLDITGDIDVRVDVEPDNWVMSGTRGQYLVMKWNQATNNRSWVFWIDSFGYLKWTWSSTGSAISSTATSTVPIDMSIARQSFRITVDVNNGAGGADYRFYTSDSVTGTWTQLGGTLTGGVTSLFSGSAPLGLGRVEDGVVNPLAGGWPFAGRFHRMQLRNGIGGTLVADMNAAARSPGDTSWSDGLATPNTWLVTSPAEITTNDYRFYGELSELPQQWDSTGTDVFVPVVASGPTRRATQGQAALDSALFHFLSPLENTGYWPCEDESQSTSLANNAPGGRAAIITDVTLGFDDSMPASAGVVRINSSASQIRGTCRRVTATGDMYLILFFKCDTTPTGTVDVVDLYTSGHAYRVRLSIVTSGASFRMEAFDADGASLGFHQTNHGRDITEWIATQIRITDTGAGYDIEHEWLQVGQDGLSSVTVTVGSGSVGVPTRWAIGGDADLADVSFTHIQTGATDYSIFDANFVRAARAFVGEVAAERWLRLLFDRGMSGWVVGDPAETEPMGPQPIASLFAALQECVDADRGIMYEARDQLGYMYRTRRSLHRQEGPSIDYSAGELSGQLAPVDDDQLIRNDVTVSRPAGSSARVVRTDGELGTDAVGVYDTRLTKNAYTDGRLRYLAGHETFLGTWDESRYPLVQVELARSEFLGAGTVKAAALARLDVGDAFNLTGLPAWLPPDDVAVMVQGYTETLRNRGRELRWNTSPYGPYLYANHLAENVAKRAAAVDSWLDDPVDDNDLALNVRTDSGPSWGTTADKPGNFPMDIEVGGEVMTVSAIAAAVGGVQAFTLSARSVNGVVKSHAAETFVQVVDRFYAQL